MKEEIIDLFNKMNKQEQGEVLAELFTDSVNTFNKKELTQAFFEKLSNEHRTLQQSVNRFMIEWLEYVASQDYYYDGRNEASHKIAKQMIEAFKEYKKEDYEPSKYLPLI